MAGDELPEPVAEKTASHEAIDLQAINGSISTETLKEQMETKINVLNVNIVNKDGDMVKEEEEVPYKLGICEQNQIITEKPENLEKFTVTLELVPKNEETSSPVEKPNAEEQDKVNGETENELHTTQFSEELSPVVKGDEIPPNGIPLLSEEIQEKTDSEEVTKEVHQNQISDEDETEKDAVQRSSVATMFDNDNQKELEIPIENASENPEDVTNEVDVPSSTTPLVTDEVLEEANRKNDVSEEAQKERIHQIETPKKDLAEEKECRDETEDQSKDVPLAGSLEETIPEETSQENQAPEMTCEEIERNEASINEMEKTSRLDNEETIPDEVSISYDQSTENEESSKRDEGSDHMSEDIKVDDVAETATPLILEVAKGSTDIKEDATEEAHKNKISNEDGTDKDAGQSTSVIELSESDDQNETVKAIENVSTNSEEEVIKELNLKEDESPSSVQEEILEEAKEKVDVVEVQNEQNFEEVKPTEDNIAMGEKEETMQNEDEENAKDLTSSHQDITNEETEKLNEDSEHISDESTLETVTTRDVAPEIDIQGAEIEALTSETDNSNIEKIEEENEEISVGVGLSESSDAPMKIEEATLNECKGDKSEEHEKLKHQETDDEQEVESCLETKEQFDESKPSPSEEEVCAEREIVETKPLNETDEGEENLAQNEIPSESKETNSEDEEEICDEKSTEVSETAIHEENDANEGTGGDQLVEVKGQDDEAVKENIEEISEPTEASNDTGALIDTEISSEKVELQSENTVSSQLITNEEVELQNENTASSQLTTSEEVLPEVPSESTTISEMEKEDKRNELLDSKTENMEVESSHEDDPNKNSEAEGSAEVTEAPEEDRQDRTSERSYEQEQVVPEKTTEEDDLTISSDGNEIETEKPEIANASSQGQEENSAIPQKDDELVLEVKPEEETKVEILEKFLPEKATEEDDLTIASNENEIETEKPEISEALSQGQDDKNVIPNDDESVLEVKPEEETEVEILENEQITQKLEEVDEPCNTQNKEEIPEAENAIESKEISTDSSISTTQQEKQSEESDAKLTQANQTTDDISEEEGMETNVTLISGIEQIDERSIAKEEEATTLAENTVLETPDEETEGETEKQIEEIPQITAPSEVSEVELGQSETLASGTENFEVISNEKSGDDTKSNDVEAKSAELESPTDESLAQKETSVETSNAREVQIDGTEQEVKRTEPDQAADEVSAAENSEDNAQLSASVAQIGKVEGLVVDDGKDKNSVIPQNVDEPELEVKAEEETKDETLKNEELTPKLEVDKEPCITQNKEELPEVENTIENKETSTDSSISTLQGDQQSEESDAKPSDANQATDVISEEVEQISERSIAKEEETTTQEENSVVETRKEETEGESTEEQIKEVFEMTDPSEVTEVELSQSEIVGPETEELEVVSNEKFGEESELTDAHSKSSEPESTTDELIEGKETCVEQFDERSITKEQGATIQEHNIVVETQKGEAEGESNEEKMEEIPEITGPSEITEIEISQSETVAPKTENVEVVSNEKFEDESKSTDLESTIGESTEQKEISTEPSNTREVQIETEKIIVLDQLIQESDVKPTEVDQATDEVFAVANSEDNVTLSASAEQIGVEESIAKDESMSLQEEDDVVVKMPEEEAEKIEAANEKQMEEEIPQITNPSEFNEVELSQSEIVAPETENMKAVPYEKSGDDTKLIDTYSKSAELKSTTDESTEHDEISSQPINTREQQINQTEITTEQDELNQMSDKNPTEPEQVTDKVSEVENSEVNATLSASIEQTGEAEGLVANKESVILQEENVVAEMPEEEADQKVEATNEKKIEEISEITGPSEITEIKISQTETVAPETENLDVVSNEKFDDESKSTKIDANSADLESTTGESTEQMKISTERSNTREVQPEHDNITVQDQLSQESDVKPTEVDQATDEVSAVVKSEDNATLSASADQSGETEESVAKEESVSLQVDEDVVTKMPEEEAEKTEAANEKQMEEEVSDKNPTEYEQVTDKFSEVENSEIDATEGLVSNKESVVLHEENVVAEMLEEEADQKVEATNEKQIEEISEITGPSEITEINGPSEITEIKISRTEIVAPETENLEVVSNEKFDDERKSTEIDANSADLESTTCESTEQKEISTEPSNTREVQPEHDNITAQDQPSQESDVKPTAVDQATDEVSTVVKSEDNATLSASAEQIGEIEESVSKEEIVNLQEDDDVVAKMPEEEAEKTEAANEKQMEEEIPRIVNPSDITEVELSQSETVAPETENIEVVSDEKFDAETELTGTYSKSAELASTTDESTEHNEIATEPINIREVQIDQTEITTEQDELNQVSDTKPTEPDEDIDKVVSEVENSKVNAVSSTSIEQTGEAEGLVATNENVILQKKDVVAEMPEEEADQEVEAADEKHIEEVPQIVNSSEVTEDQLVESEPVGPEVELSEIVSDQKFGDGSEFGETDLRSDQMETMVEKPNADLSSSVGQITERSEENEGLLKVTGEQVQGEKTDAIEAVEEPTDKHIDGEFRRTGDSEIYDTADEELKTISTEKEVNPPIFETQTESPVQEKETEESVLAEEKSDIVTLVSGEGHIEEIESANKESGVLLQSTTELPEQKVSQAVETHEEPSDKDIAGEISEIINPNEITEVQLVESETLHPETEQLVIGSNETLGDESKLDETVVKLAQMGSTSDKIIEEKLNANLSSSGEQICEKSEESEVVLQRTDELVQGERIDAVVPKEETSQGIEVAEDPCDKHIEGEKPDAEMLKEEGSQGIEVAEDPCDKHIEGQIHRTADPEICYAAEESKDVLTENEVEIFGTETESTEKTTEESASVENSDATATLVPDEGHVEVESANRESNVVPQSTTESVAVPEERVPLENDASEEQSEKDIVGEISKIASLETHDGAVQSEIMLNEEKVDSEELRTEIESPNLENATKESTLVEEKSDDTANLVHSEGQIEEIEIASKESRVSPESTIESVTLPEENVSEGIETNEEPSDKHIVEEQDNISVDNFEASEEIHLVHEDKVDQAQTTASSVEQHDLKNDGTEMESAYLENTNDDIDVKENLDASVISIVEEQGAVINRTDKGSESVPAVEETHSETTKLIDEKILSDVPPETSNSTETEKLHVKEDALDTVISEPEGQTKHEDLMTQSQEEISGQDKDIANITSEAVSEEVNRDTNQKDGDQHMENAAGQEAIDQTERDIDVTELLKAAEKVEVDETNEVSRETVPNLSEQSKEVEEEAEQSEVPEQDFASIVSSFLINKVLSDENQKVDDGMKQNNDALSIPKPLDGETIQEIATTKTEPEAEHEEMLYGTSSREEAKLQIQEPEEENGEKTVEENGEEDGVEHDYLPVSRFLMDKILRQEENKNLPEEKAIEETDTHPVNDSGIQVEEQIEETDKDLVNDGGDQVEKKIEENSHIVLVPEQKGEMTSFFAELPRDFEKGETLIGKAQSTFAGDDAIFIEEKAEENTAGAELTKLEGEGSHSPIEAASDFEKEEKPAEAPKPIEDKNETLVSDVGISSVEKDEGDNSSGVVVAEKEGESISPVEALRDFEKENKSMEQKNEALITDEGISSIENIVENAGDVALPKQGEKTFYPEKVATDFDDNKKPSEEKDDTTVSFDEVKEGGNSKVAFEEVEDLAYREHSKDLIEKALINAQEISNSEEAIEENRTLGTQKEEEHKKEVIVDEEMPKDVKNVEENYVFVEHEPNQFEEPKEILEEEKVTDEAIDATVSNLQEKQTNLSDAKTNLVGQVEISEKGMKNSSVSCQDIEQSPSDTPKIPMATKIVKELVGNETEFIHGEEHLKEVTDTVVDSTENRSQEKLAEIEGTKIEKKSEDNKSEEHEEEEEEEEEDRHQERETEIIGRDLTVKAEARETEMKSAQKKSHNILSGVGSKVKHSFAKVKKAITGKSKNVSPSAK